MAMTEQERKVTAPIPLEVAPGSTTMRYPGVPDVSLPAAPQVEIRRAGFLGWGIDGQDAGHERRVRELHHLGVETHYAEAMAVALEVRGIKASSDAMRKAEDIVYSIPQNTVTAMVAADLASDMASRLRMRHGRLAETYDAEAMNIIHRR